MSPYAEYEFPSFDPSLSNLFPNPPPLPSSADLFSPSETNDLLGFLDNFGDFNWENENVPLPPQYASPPEQYLPSSYAPYSNPHLNTVPEPSTSARPRRSTRSVRHSAEGATRSASQASSTSDSSNTTAYRDPHSSRIPHNTPHPHHDSTTKPNDASQLDSPTPLNARAKPLLSTPQKRLNHIMSEQKRRNAIRDGYAQLISLLAPTGASGQGIGMPTRGRPKGSGSRGGKGAGQTKGKSGVLFRAVEYCRWLEEGRDALREEVARMEGVAGIRHHAS